MKILLFGATGSAGAAVLDACLNASIVDEVRAIVRRPLMDTSGPSCAPYVHKDFLDYADRRGGLPLHGRLPLLLGISAMQVSQGGISHHLLLLTRSPPPTCLKTKSPGAAFHYISGAGTGPGRRQLWARVKAQTEHDLIELVDADCWRPAFPFIDAKPSGSLPKIYELLQPLGRLFKPFPNLYVHGHDIGRAMLQATTEKLRRRIIENAEIRQIAARATF